MTFSTLKTYLRSKELLPAYSNYSTFKRAVGISLTNHTPHHTPYKWMQLCHIKRNNESITFKLNHFHAVLTPLFLCVNLCVLPGLRSSLRLDGESMRSRASAASKVLSEQWMLVPWTDASTETHTHTHTGSFRKKFRKNKITGWAQWSLCFLNIQVWQY